MSPITWRVLPFVCSAALVLGFAASPSAAQAAPRPDTAVSLVVEMLSAAPVTPASADGSCEFVPSAKAAWCYYSKYSTGFEASARYGERTADGQYIWYGIVDLYFRVLIKTNRAYAQITFYHSAKKEGGSYGTMQLGMAAQRIYYSPHCPAGCPVSPSTLKTYKYPGNIPVNKWVYWDKNPNYGYEASQPPVQVGGVNVTFLWTDSRLPYGYYCFGKSIHYYFREVGGKLTDSAVFYGPQAQVWKAHLGQSPAGCGTS